MNIENEEITLRNVLENLVLTMKNISKEEAKQELRQTLDDGIAALSKTPIKVEKHETTLEFKPKNK